MTTKNTTERKFTIEQIETVFRRWAENDEDGEWFDNGFDSAWKCFSSFLLGIRE